MIMAPATIEKPPAKRKGILRIIKENTMQSNPITNKITPSNSYINIEFKSNNTKIEPKIKMSC